MRGEFDPHVEAVQRAVAAFRPLALRATGEMLVALDAMEAMTPGPEASQLVADASRHTANLATFLDDVLGALDPATGRSFPPMRQPRLRRYSVPNRVLLAMEGGCTRSGWETRVGAQRLAGVRALYFVLGIALGEDLARLVDLQPLLAARVTLRIGCQPELEAFELGLQRLMGLLELLADAQRVVYMGSADGQQVMDLFTSAEPG